MLKLTQAEWDEQTDKHVIVEAHSRQDRGLWRPDETEVIRARTNIRAHLLRTHELLEEMREDALSSGAGGGVLKRWDNVMIEVDSAKNHVSSPAASYLTLEVFDSRENRTAFRGSDCLCVRLRSSSM